MVIRVKMKTKDSCEGHNMPWGTVMTDIKVYRFFV